MDIHGWRNAFNFPDNSMQKLERRRCGDWGISISYAYLRVLPAASASYWTRHKAQPIQIYSASDHRDSVQVQSLPFLFLFLFSWIQHSPPPFFSQYRINQLPSGPFTHSFLPFFLGSIVFCTLCIPSCLVFLWENNWGMK